MRQEHRAGERMFVDHAGQTVPVVDPETGELRQAQVFVAVLGASSYTFAEATCTQTLPDWTASHVPAFAFFDLSEQVQTGRFGCPPRRVSASTLLLLSTSRRCGIRLPGQPPDLAAIKALSPAQA